MIEPFVDAQAGTVVYINPEGNHSEVAPKLGLPGARL
jgi:hypothetical protein